VGTYYKSTLSAITHKLNVSSHMLIRTFFLFWYVQLVPRVCPHLSVTPCIVRIIKYRSGLESYSSFTETLFAVTPCAWLLSTNGYTQAWMLVKIIGGTPFVILFKLWMEPWYGSPLHSEDLRRLQRSADWPASLMRQRSCRMVTALWTSISRYPLHLCKGILDYVISCGVRCLKTWLM
jgi:hypothetical protein